MLHEFLHLHREELAARCRVKVATRPSPQPTAIELDYGVPLLIDQLVTMLRIEQTSGQGSRGSQDSQPTEIDRSASQHGGELLHRGFTVDQVVHDYGDLCQALTELADEKSEPISVPEFHTFNRCLDGAIASAVGEYGRQRENSLSESGTQSLNERLGRLAHELRNLINTATLAYAAIKEGHGAVAGATGAVLDRSLDGLRTMIDRALVDVRLTAGLDPHRQLTSLELLLEAVRVAAQLDATARKVAFTMAVEPGLTVMADREMLSSALANLLQNAFKFTRAGGSVSLTARLADDHVLIEVADQCGGLPPGTAESLFVPFAQRGKDRSGVGLGLSISRRCVEANGGTLGVRDIPGTGCVFTIDLPRT
ncbi:MAG: HAMP domain-containing sensor histidine kinase [Kofleriaceae bacterium]